MKPKRVVFIVNPEAAAGRGLARWSELRAGFVADHAGANVLFTSQAGEATRLAQQVAPGCDVVVAVGGDGTAFEVASGLLLSRAENTRFGIVPIGTGNDIARQCGVPDTAQARLALRGGCAKPVDVIRIQCHQDSRLVRRYALLYGAVGFMSEVLRRTTPAVKRLFGRRLAYPVGALWAIPTYRCPRIRVTCDEQSQERRFIMICVSNSEEAGGGMRLAPGAVMNDGLLNVNICEAINRVRVVALLYGICRRRRLSHPKLRYFTARSISLEAERPIQVEADGELIGHTPASLEVMPKALNVMIP